MQQLRISFDQVPATAPQSSTAACVCSERTDCKKVSLRKTSITANMVKALCEGGFFTLDEYDFELEPVVVEYAATQGVRVDLDAASREDCDVYDTAIGTYYEQFDYAVEQLREAMADAQRNRGYGYYSVWEYVEDVYYYYGINATCKGETAIPYSDFIRACKDIDNQAKF